MGFIGGEGQVEPMLALELVLSRDRVGRDAKQLGSCFLKLRTQLGELYGFAGASRSVGFRVEENAHLASFECGTRDVPTSITGELERRRF